MTGFVQSWGAWVALSFFTLAAWGQNQAPVVSIAAVPNLTAPATIASLSATVSDDGLSGQPLVLWWAKFEGPGRVTFEDREVAATTAHFDVAGDYVLQLTADDGLLRTRTFVNVTLNDPANLPVVVQDILDATASNGLDPLFEERFLTRSAGTVPPNATGAQYYAAIDPLNERTTFTDWKQINGFPLAAPPLVLVASDTSTGCCAAAVYGNASDLGFGRRMVMGRNGEDVSFYVENYRSVDSTVAENGADFLATVTMEYSGLPGDDPANRYIKFFVFDEQGNRITDIDFDGRGPKTVPAACVVCHGGTYMPDGSLPAEGRLGSIYLPFDTSNLDYPADPEFALREQEAPIREFNLAIMDTNIPMAVRELIEGFYGGFGLPSMQQNQAFVPSGWTNEPELYRQVVAPSCRSCHVARTSTLGDFDRIEDWSDPARALIISGSFVFGPTPSGFRMPHALTTFTRFWLSTSPSQPDVLASAFDASGAFIGLGAPPGRIYVDANAIGAATDGSSWENAMLEVSDALDQAAIPANGITEIWVAAGTYLPSTAGLGDVRDATFNLASSVSIYGGFLGGETLLEERVPGANATVLSGDLSGDDDDAFGFIGDNVRHVVTANATSSATRLDGLTIRGGNAEGAFDARGGGVHLSAGALALVNCVVNLNTATEGGGVFVDAGILRAVASNWTENRAELVGAGLSLDNGAEVEATSSVFHHNVVTMATGLGGAIYAFGGDVQLRNVSMNRNVADVSGGGLHAVGGGDVRIVNSIFWENDSTGFNEDAQIAFDNSQGVVVFAVDRSIVTGLTGALGGMDNSGADPLFVDALGADGVLGTLDEIFELGEGSPAIDQGDNNSLSSDFFDLDNDGDLGELSSLDAAAKPRFFEDFISANFVAGGVTPLDLGAFEYDRPSLGAVGAGNVGIGVGGPFDILSVNASFGGAPRRVDVGLNQPILIDVAQPPSNPSPAPFAVFGRIGVPQPSEAFILPFGIGFIAFPPEFVSPFQTSFGFTLADNIGLGRPPLLPSTPTPWSVNVAGGLDVVSDIVLQGIVFDPTSPFFVRVTNGVVVSLRENFLGNEIPTAVVTEESIRVCVNQAVTMMGVDSSDPDGDMLGFTWTQTMGTAVVLIGADTDTASFTAPAVGEILTFELVVDDGVASSDPVVVTVEVADSGEPIAIAGADVEAITNATVTLDGSASCDPDQVALVSFNWTLISGPAVVPPIAMTAMPSFTAPSTSTTYVFELTVTDAEGLTSDPDSVVVQVFTSFDNDVFPLFDSITGDLGLVCIICHSASHPGGASGGMDFDQAPATVRTDLLLGRVNVPGAGNGDPLDSQLLTRPLMPDVGPADATPPTGDGISHPGGVFFMTASDSNYLIIRAWIEEGAQAN